MPKGFPTNGLRAKRTGHAKRSLAALEVHDDYCGVLLAFRAWCEARGDSFTTGLVRALEHEMAKPPPADASSPPPARPPCG